MRLTSVRGEGSSARKGGGGGGGLLMGALPREVGVKGGNGDAQSADLAEASVAVAQVGEARDRGRPEVVLGQVEGQLVAQRTAADHHPELAPLPSSGASGTGWLG
jgi:hypothetical protein